jgi:hypothetical protein
MKLKNKILTFALALLAFMLALFFASAATASDFILLPYTTLPSGAPGSTGYTTNLSAGWTNSTIGTNTTDTWVVTNSTMVHATNYVTNSTVMFADINVSHQADLTLMSGYILNGSTGTGASLDRTLTFARVSDLGYVDTVGTLTWTYPGNGTTNAYAATNITSWVGGFKKVRLISDQYLGTNGLVMTNLTFESQWKNYLPSPSGR